MKCKFGFHVYDSDNIGTSLNNCVDYYCGNCESFMFSNHIENSDIVKEDYNRLINAGYINNR